MSRPPAGNYIIYSRVLGPSGQKLAITDHGDGENQFSLVEPFGDDDTFNRVVRNPAPLLGLHFLCYHSY